MGGAVTPPEAGDLRDRLALQRTLLANERTLLAYVRTALALVGVGAGLLHFFEVPLIRGTGWALIAAGAVLLLIGALRFATVRRRLHWTSPVLLLLFAAPLAAQLPPDATWRTFDTEHFRVHFTPEIEPTARRAAERAERAYTLLSRDFVEPPEGRIDLVVADNVDFSNGYATPFPTNRIVIYAHSPADQPTLSFTDDWLELVVLHELVHIFHLDTAGGVWQPLRSVFGRYPLLFPQIWAPGWVTEGLATYYESRLTRAGRVRSTLQKMALRTAILEDEFFGIDRATGDPVSWPGASTRYIYGSMFVDHLAHQYGPEPVVDWVETSGRRLIPYRLNAAARSAFGTPFTNAWTEWRDSLQNRYTALADSLRTIGLTEPEIFTDAGRIAEFPRYSPSGETIAYVASTGREEPSTRLLLADGQERTLAPRTSIGPATWYPDGERLLTAQLRYEDPYRIYADLYRIDADGDPDRLTDGARIWEPDLHPDGRRVVAVTNADGTNALIVHDLATGTERLLRPPALDTAWSLPRWSPTGDQIAVGRWRAGGFFDVVVLDSLGTLLREITADRATESSPAWSPDGNYVVFSSDRTGITNLYAFDLARGTLHQVTNVLTGAFQPDVSPDGRWIAFSYYRADGYHIARIPFNPITWREAPPIRSAVEAAPADPAVFTATAGGPAHPYSPWRSLAPASWSPAVRDWTDLGLGVGAAVGGEDIVGRHEWSAEALAYTDGPRFEGGLAYRYRGLGNPVLDFRVSQEWSVLSERGFLRDSEGNPILNAILRREREVGASAIFVRPNWRHTSWVQVGSDFSDDDYVWDDPERIAGSRPPFGDVPPEVGATVDVGYSSIRGYAFSVSPENGFLLAGSVSGRRYTRPPAGEEETRGYVRLTGRGRAFQGIDFGGFARHAVALRLNAGAETGSLAPGFGVGGASGAVSPLPLDFSALGGGLTYPIRGYRQGAQFGDRAFSATAEYRVPLLLVERGLGLVPLFLDRIWGDVFIDVGSAWCAEDCERRFRGASPEFRPLPSVGAELNVGLRTGYFVDLPLRGGIAFPLRDTPGQERSPEFYLRLGRSF